MWLIRFQLLETKDYNYIKRHLKKAGFIPRRNSPVIFIKASCFHLLQKKSWRSISSMFQVNHIMLHKFHNNYIQNPEIIKIFHILIDRNVIVFIGENKLINKDYLDNNDETLKLTKARLESIFASL